MEDIERRTFESRAEAERYVALARGFKDVQEMRSHFAAHPLNSVETRDVDDFSRRLALLKLESE
jgi:hypothetical protein